MHRIGFEDFDALAAGRGDLETVRLLWSTELSRRLLLVQTVVEVTRGLPAARFSDPLLPGLVTEAYRVLAAATRRRRDRVVAVLMRPEVGGWVTRCLRQVLRCRNEGARASVAMEADLHHLCVIAVAAAAQAGEPVTLPVRPSVDGWLRLPVLGDLFVGVQTGTRALSATVTERPATLRVGDRTVKLAAGGEATIWPDDCDSSPLRAPVWLRLGAADQTLAVALQTDPGSIGLDSFAGSDGLTPVGFREWSVVLGRGWRLLVERDPDRAAVVAATLTTIVPLRAACRTAHVSATSGDAFGAVAMTRPPDPMTAAAALVHEVQHAKLYALLHVVELIEPATDRQACYYAPWRPDPRPLTGLLQGAYAFLGLVEFWGSLTASRDPEIRRRAAAEIVRWRGSVNLVLDVLAASKAVTPLGRRFLGGMRSTMKVWQTVAVDGDVAAAALHSAAQHLMDWTSRHGGLAS
ncbi:hypothetical protein I6A60_37710 [Frankia sp. AgB1.9]|nr:hypothetical protein [Frankia sp. AgB1.9]